MAQNFLYLAYEALGHPIGIAVPTNDPQRLRQRIYAERAAAKDPLLDCLALRISPSNPTGELWITKEKVEEK